MYTKGGIIDMVGFVNERIFIGFDYIYLWFKSKCSIGHLVL